MIVNSGELPNIRRNFEESRIALRFGTYDVLHSGHKEGLEYAAEKADILVVGVMPDEYVSKIKGPERPINPIDRRIAAIDEAEAVDYSFVSPRTSLGVIAVMRTLRPDIYIEGREHAERTAMLKAGLLGVLGVEYAIHDHSRYESSSSMLAHFGREEAIAISGLNFCLRELEA